MNWKKENKQLCPNCKAGRDSYLLDSRAPFCPYLSLHTGGSCAKFKPLPKSAKHVTKN